MSQRPIQQYDRRPTGNQQPKDSGSSVNAAQPKKNPCGNPDIVQMQKDITNLIKIKFNQNSRQQ